ncbi:MAG TPA: adenosylcobinamide-GDP ribazoletransferase, partial [Pirellulales bacterium]
MTITTDRRTARPLRGLISAIEFLTRIPISPPADEGFDLAATAAWFPLVGAAIGLATGGVI